MVRLQERHFWMGLVLGWVLLVAMAQVLAGCGDPLAAAPPACAPGEVASEGGGCEPRKPCAPGELTLESGECQPAGLPPDMQCPPGEFALANGGCQPAGLPPDMQCPPGELALANGGCQPAGVPPEACGEGFVPDGDRGCEPILPAEVCPPGLMAIPGETTCREVAPCGDGPWGTIPVEANTQFVDQAYAAGDSDGTAARPWTRVQDGVDAAEDGAIVAVTDGTYVEDVLIGEKAVRLWGRCPGRVEIQGTGIGRGAIGVLTSATDGSEVRRLSIIGARHGITVSGASDVAIEEVWVHDATESGVEVVDAIGPTSALLVGSLIERNHENGVFVSGAQVKIERTAVRSTEPVDGHFGRGIGIQNNHDTGARANVTIHACLVDSNHDLGVFVWSSDADIQETVVRSTQPLDGRLGVGIGILDDASTSERSNVSVRASVVEQNHDVGVLVLGSDAEIVSTVVRSTQPVNGQFGTGVEIVYDPETGERAKGRIQSSVIERNHAVGVSVMAADAELEGVVVRSTQYSSGDLALGINVETDYSTGERACASIRSSVVERNNDSGLLIVGSDVEVEGTVIRANNSETAQSGRGINIENDAAMGERAEVSVRACLVEENSDVGVFVVGSRAEIEATVIRATQPVNEDEDSGRGISVQDHPETGDRAEVSVQACLIDQNHYIGVFVGGSDAKIAGTVVRSTQPWGIVGGHGIHARDSPSTGQRADVSIQTCLIEQNHGVGVFVAGSDAEMIDTVVRSTQPVHGDGGWGIGIQDDSGTGERADMSIRTSVVEQNHEVGVFVYNSHAEIEAAVVRSTRGLDGHSGMGAVVMGVPDTGNRADVVLRSCVVEQNQRAGLAFILTDAVVDGTVVRGTTAERSRDSGDGITFENCTAAVHACEVSGNARAGVGNWGSDVKITSTRIVCNRIGVNGETLNETRASFSGSSEWLCSRFPEEERCAETDTCSVDSASIEPPPPLVPLEPLPNP